MVSLHLFQDLETLLQTCLFPLVTMGTIDGTFYQMSHLAQLGRLLGRIHSVGTTATFQHRHRISSKLYGYDAQKLILDSQLLPNYVQESYASVSKQLLGLVDAQLEGFNQPQYRRIHFLLHLQLDLNQKDQHRK